MMDLKEIIKWFIPCFHLLLRKINKIGVLLTICLVLLFSCPTLAEVNQNNAGGLNSGTKNLFNSNFNSNQSVRSIAEAGHKFLEYSSEGRTFGRPFKKMMQALIPLVFQLGAASTWAVVAALVGLKTLAVTLVILKLLLLAGAVKIGALFASKSHPPEHQTWSPQQKEIHLHIHNNGHGDEHVAPISPWSREGVPNIAETKTVNVAVDPFAAGSQTISTPYGHYVKVDPSHTMIK